MANRRRTGEEGDGGSSLRWLYAVLGRDRAVVFLLSVVRIASGLTATLFAIVLKSVIDACMQKDMHRFGIQLAFLLGVSMLSVGLPVFGNFVEEKCKALLESRFRMRQFSRLLTRSYARVSAVHSGEWLTRISSDSMIVVRSVTEVFPSLFGLAAQVLSAFVALALLLPVMLYILIPGSILLVLYSAVFRKKLKLLHKDIQLKDGAVRSFIQERLTGMIVLRAFNWQRSTTAQASERMAAWTAARIRRAKWMALYGTGLQGGTQIGYLAGIVLCCLQLLMGVASYGTLIAVLQLAKQAGQITGLASMAPQYFAMLGSIERMREVEAFPPESELPAKSRDETQRFYDEKFRALGLRQAVFAYPDTGEIVLSGLSLEIRKGSFTAFAGPSGSGKTTVLRLLLGLYDLRDGALYLRDDAGTEQPLDASWRTLFAYVPQGNFLFTGTVREGVTLGRPNPAADEEALWRALSVACADGFVRELPDGLDTQLGERGSGLSEGQLQRLAVARAVYSRRPVLILDESTSALDPDTERQMLDNIRTMTDHTVILVTHRESALAYCDAKVLF